MRLPGSWDKVPGSSLLPGSISLANLSTANQALQTFLSLGVWAWQAVDEAEAMAIDPNVGWGKGCSLCEE